MKPKQSKITLEQLKKNNPKGWQVMDLLIKEFVKITWSKLKIANMGYEATIETVEKLIEKGYLKIFYDPSRGIFTLMTWREDKGEYV